MNCINLHPNGKKCKVLVNDECDENCSAKITDPLKYMAMLEDILLYSKDNSQSCADIRKQMKDIIKRYNLQEPEEKIELSAFKDWRKVYNEELHRGDRGGSSDKDANSATSMKQKMKDNRPPECKMTKSERQKIKEELEKWEAKHGKLEKLSRSPLTRTKIDSYTGEEIK